MKKKDYFLEQKQDLKSLNRKLRPSNTSNHIQTHANYNTYNVAGQTNNLMSVGNGSGFVSSLDQGKGTLATNDAYFIS